MADRKRDDADEQRPRKCYNVRDAWEAPGCFHTNQKELKNKNNKKTEQHNKRKFSCFFFVFFQHRKFFSFPSDFDNRRKNDWKNVFFFLF